MPILSSKESKLGKFSTPKLKGIKLESASNKFGFNADALNASITLPSKFCKDAKQSVKMKKSNTDVLPMPSIGNEIIDMGEICSVKSINPHPVNMKKLVETGPSILKVPEETVENLRKSTF